MKKLVSSFIIGAMVLSMGLVSFAAPLHTPECNGKIYTKVKRSNCGCPHQCVKIYYCTECGQIGASPVLCPN